jgi:hypothetical protein
VVFQPLLLRGVSLAGLGTSYTFLLLTSYPGKQIPSRLRKVKDRFSLVVNEINVLSETLVNIVKVWQMVERKRMEPVY